MQQQQFIGFVNQPQLLQSAHLAELDVLVKEYPFFETAHLLYAKGLHKFDTINYSKQLRKTAIVANSRTILYDLLNKIEASEISQEEAKTDDISIQAVNTQEKTTISPVTVTNTDIKVIYINTVSAQPSMSNLPPVQAENDTNEIDIVKAIENNTETPVQDFNIDKLNKSIEQDISSSIIQSYVQTDILKTPELTKEEVKEPSSFTDWLKTIQKEAHTFQTDTKSETVKTPKTGENEAKKTEIVKKTSFFDQNKQIIDKIIESDPGRIKLGTNKFFTPAAEAKQSLLVNEHLVTETLAKIYALQGNISKAIRAYEILSLKFPQKSVYFATLIENLKTNK